MQQRGGIVLCWDKVGYQAGRMASMGGGRRILDRCSGTARPGEVLQRMPYVNLVCPHSSLSSYFEVVGVIGPSGAGKSTLLNRKLGRVRFHAAPSFDGEGVTKKNSYRIGRTAKFTA